MEDKLYALVSYMAFEGYNKVLVVGRDKVDLEGFALLANKHLVSKPQSVMCDELIDLQKPLMEEWKNKCPTYYDDGSDGYTVVEVEGGML